MSSTQRSRALAALIFMVALLAVAAVLGNVLSDSGDDAAGSGVNLLTPAGAADLQVNAAALRTPGKAGVTAWRLAAPKYRTRLPRAGRPQQVTTTMTPPATEAPNGSSTLPPAAPTTTLTTAKAVTTASVATSPTVTTPSSGSVTTQKPPPTVMPPSSTPTTSPTSVVTVPATTPTTAKPTTTTTAPTTSSTVVTQPPPTSGAMSGVELEIARMTNELRTNPTGPLARKKADPTNCGLSLDANGKAKPVAALTVSEAVSVNLSRPWSVDMNSRNTMDHRSSASALAIYKQLGIAPSTYGENVAWFQGYSDAQAAQVFFEGWRESDGHYCNMMSAGYTSFGVGVYKGATRSWATQNFYATR